jgi:hypothetical protein
MVFGVNYKEKHKRKNLLLLHRVEMGRWQTKAGKPNLPWVGRNDIAEAGRTETQTTVA